MKEGIFSRTWLVRFFLTVSAEEEEKLTTMGQLFEKSVAADKRLRLAAEWTPPKKSKKGVLSVESVRFLSMPSCRDVERTRNEADPLPRSRSRRISSPRSI